MSQTIPPTAPWLKIKWDGSPVRLQFPFAEDHIAGVIRRAKTFYEIDLLRDAMSRLFFAKCAVDVGAHVGNHTVFFAKAMGLRTIAFEPNPITFRLLEVNVAANGLAEQCRLYMAAVGSEPFRAKLRTHGAQRNSGACGVELTPKGDVSR